MKEEPEIVFVSPFNSIGKAQEKAQELRKLARGIVKGSRGQCKHNRDLVEITQSTNTNADNNKGLETDVKLTCHCCQSVAEIVGETPVCLSCSTSQNLVWTISVGPVKSGKDRDYNQYYTIVCPKCNKKEEITLLSGYS